jgi:transcriptional regulator with XRE-family HTH domain
LRIRRHLRQIDVATQAGVSRATISNIERGHLSTLSIQTLMKATAAVGGEIDLRVRWHGAELDRLLDEGHARLTEHAVRRLETAGWDCLVEATFSIAGERGSIDVLARHRRTGHVLVVEVKTVVPDFQAMVAAIDRKTRLAPQIAEERGWPSAGVSRLLIIEAGSTARDHVARMDRAMRATFPARGIAVRAWLWEPDVPISGLVFIRSATQGGVTDPVTGRQRVRCRRTAR